MISYLIGTNHAHQLEGYIGGDSIAFAAYLTAFCSDNRIDLIAEELNEEAIKVWSAQGSVAHSVASQLSICHLFCDPGREDRGRLGILTENTTVDAKTAMTTWPARERFWLERLREVPFHRCAFVLGVKHIQTFGNLLSSDGFTVHVAQSYWSP